MEQDDTEDLQDITRPVNTRSSVNDPDMMRYQARGDRMRADMVGYENYARKLNAEVANLRPAKRIRARSFGRR